MSNRTRGLLLALLTILVHMKLVEFAQITLSPNRNLPTLTANLIPFGQVTYTTVTTIATIEFLVLVVLLVLFGISLFRDE